MTRKKPKTVTLDPANHEFLQEQDNASALVNDLVEQYRRNGDRGTVGLELQREQKKREAKHARERAERLQNDVEELDALIREFERDERADLAEARDVLSGTPKDPNNPAVQRWAKDLGLTPQQLLDEL
jgi:hypothetical protein